MTAVWVRNAAAYLMSVPLSRPRHDDGVHDWAADDSPNPFEPGLTDDELVGVRGLLQERYVDGVFRERGEPMYDTGPMRVRRCRSCDEYGCVRDGYDTCPEGLRELAEKTADAAAEWIGGAVPAIVDLLTDHFMEVGADGFIYCYSPTIGSGSHGRFAKQSEWRDHIAPIIANALAPQPK